MSGLFPNNGVPYNETLNGVDVPTDNCSDELFYGTNRCQPRFDPAAMNAMISEFLNAITAYGEEPYDCSRLDNLARALGDISFRVNPTGMVAPFAMETPPSGWLQCDGAAVSRTTYAPLFAALGTSYGAGDGTTTFNVPDLRGEFIRGWDDGRNVDPARTLASSQASQSRHVKQVQSAKTFSNSGDITIPSDGSWSTYIETQRGNDNADRETALRFKTSTEETRPRNIAMNYCIKT